MAQNAMYRMSVAGGGHPQAQRSAPNGMAPRSNMLRPSGGMPQQRGPRNQGDSGSNSNKPQLVQVVEHLMEKQGIEYYEKNVTNQLIEFMHYYITETVQEAKLYRDYAGKDRIDVGDMRLAIAGKNYDSFTRPLPVSTVRQVADERNKTTLPEIDTMQSMSEQANSGQATQRPGINQIQPPNTLPVHPDAHTLMQPNVHVFSEEIKTQIDDRQRKMQRLVLMQLNKGQEDYLKKNPPVKEDKLKDSKSKKKSAKQQLKEKKDQESILLKSGNKSEKDENTEATNKSGMTHQGTGPSQNLLGKRKAETQIAIEFDPSTVNLKPTHKNISNPIMTDESKGLKNQGPQQQLFKSPVGRGIQDNNLLPQQDARMESAEDNIFLDSPQPKNEFALVDNPDNNLVDNNQQMLGGDNNLEDAESLQPQADKKKQGLSSFLPSMDQQYDEPEQEDQIENPFDMDDDKDNW